MYTNENIICISSIDWDFIWQGHQEVMAAFARNGNRVLFIENTGVRLPGIKDAGRIKKRVLNWLKGVKGFREARENLYVYSPVILPFPYSRLARWINRNFLFGSLRKWAKIMNFRDNIIWTFLPTGTALDLIDEFDSKCLVYYCIADFYKLANPRRIRKTEDELIKRADVIFAQGKSLKEKCLKFNQNVHIFPFGVNINIFNSAKDVSAEYAYDDIRDLKKPIIGYIGGIHRHIDFDLLAYVARSNPGSSLVLVGPVQTDVSSLRDIPNIVLLGKKDFHLLPGYIKEFDVCIIPYLKSEYTDTVYPTKLNEYHALGKPVVSTDIPEIASFNRENGDLVLTARTKEEFVRKIKDALEDKDSSLINERVRLAKKHGWDQRIEEMSDLIEDAIRRKKSSGHFDWQRRFRRVYNAARRKFIKVAAGFLAFWILVFYTPLVWFLAEPLKIADETRNVDCIVVFAGGVGESGEAGQGYEERVKYAVELYHQGIARHIIFSSGFMYIFKEPLLMRALAVSMGVPENAIILEDKAINTYQNVKFTSEILNSRGWRSIALVSSPYHMRRSALVFNKINSNLNIVYLPILNSVFYAHPRGGIICKRITARQALAILHEYLGILYYKYKGLI